MYSPHLWISAPRVAHVRARCGAVGGLLIASGVIAGLFILWAGLEVPYYFQPLNDLVVVTGVVAAFCVLPAGALLLVARGYVHGEHLDEEKAQRARTALAFLWAGTIVVAILACLLMVGLVHNNISPVPVTGAVITYFVLMVFPVALTGVAYFVGRTLLNPNSAAVPAEPA